MLEIIKQINSSKEKLKKTKGKMEVSIEERF